MKLQNYREETNLKILRHGLHGLAMQIITWQERYNKSADKLEKLTGNKQLKVKVESSENIINSELYFNE